MSNNINQEELIRELKKDSKKLLEWIKQQANTALDMDYLTNGGISWDAVDLIKYLDIPELEYVIKCGGEQYAEEARRVLSEKTKAEENSTDKEDDDYER